MRAVFLAISASSLAGCGLSPTTSVPDPAMATRAPEASAVSAPELTGPAPDPSSTMPGPDGLDQTPEPSSTPTQALPTEHFIAYIRGHHQYFPLGCETAAAKDWARFFGKDFNEFEFQYKLPLSDNPDLGFVGDVNSPWGQVPPYGYGVYAGPIADLLNRYQIPAKAYKGYQLEQLKAKLAADKPVIAWVIGNMVGGVASTYTDKKGNRVIVAAYEHVVIITGYGPDKIRYMNNGKFYEVPVKVFLTSWGVLGNMVVVDS